jgi:molybdopterin converting factor small subunit
MDLPTFTSEGAVSDERETIEITVESFGIWRDLTGSRSLTITLLAGSTLADLVALLSSRYGEGFQKWLVNPANGELWSSFAIAVNDSLIDRAAELAQELHTGDRVSFFHQVTGGV